MNTNLDSKAILLYYWIKHQGDNSRVYHAFVESEYIDLDLWDRYQIRLNESKTKYITILDDDFPEYLLAIKNTPWVIFYRGDLNLLNYHNRYALIGEADYSDHEIINSYLQNTDFALVSPHYAGFDKYVRDLQNDSHKPLIHVLAHGLDVDEIPEVADHELFISQYPLDTHIKKSRIYQHNLLVAQIATQLCTFEVSTYSKTNNLVTHFLNLGKEIVVVRDYHSLDIFHPLIDQGASVFYL